MKFTIVRRFAAGAAAGLALTLSAATFAGTAHADSNSASAPMGRGGYNMQSNVWKCAGPFPYGNCGWQTSAMAWHNAAHLTMTSITNQATFHSIGLAITVTCGGGSGCSIQGTGTANDVTTTPQVNSNTWIASMTGSMYVPAGALTRVCSAASGYSTPLGIHSNGVVTCAGSAV
ncbi:MAG: hypothetical protein ACJ73S_19020 [Mycobacteriales bacterium]|jgi:hypothetical protein